MGVADVPAFKDAALGRSANRNDVWNSEVVVRDTT